MRFRLLGPLEVLDDEGREVRLGSGRQRDLLALLLVHANEVVSTDRLVDEVWSHAPPETAVKALQGHISQLRKLLGRDRDRGEQDSVLVTRAPGYALRVGPDELDSRRFENLVAEGQRELARGAPETAAERLREALALWRGPALAEFAFREFAQSVIGRLEELRLAALEDRIEADLALGRHGELVAELQAVIAEHPLRERLRGQLMLALYRCGRQVEALQEYKTARHVLVDELGLEPSEPLQRLERAILRHDESLEPPAPAAREQPHERAAVVGDGVGPTPRQRSGPDALVGTLRRPRALAVVGLVLLAVAAAAAFYRLTDSEPAVPVSPNRVAVLDPDSGEVLAQIPVGGRPVGVAVGRGAVWVANADDGTVSRIDATRAEVVKTIGIGAPAVDIAIGPDAIWVATGSGGTLSRIDPDSNAVVATVDLRGSNALVPDAANAVAVGAGSVWVASSGGYVFRVDAETNQVVAKIRTPTVPADVGFAEDAIWVATFGERVLRIEPRTNEITARVAVGEPTALAAGTRAVWVGDLVGTIWMIDAGTAAVVDTVSVDSVVALSEGLGSVWVASGSSGKVHRIHAATRGVTTTRLAYAVGDVAVGAGRVWVSVQDERAT